MKLTVTQLRKEEIYISDRCLKNLMKMDRNRSFYDLVKQNREKTVEQYFEENKMMICGR